MKNFKRFLYLNFFGYLISSCSSSSSDSSYNPTVPIVPPQSSYNLTVNNGDGSGTISNGAVTTIYSNPPSSTQVFDKWVGDVASLTSSNEWKTTLTMPSSNINVTATYKTVTNFSFTNVVINGSQVYYYVPPVYRGIILPFHGATGSATGWTSTQLENVNFCRYAAANGYALVITESKDRINKVWDTSGANSVDIVNIDAIISSLESSGIIAANKPKYGVGMSQGSGFCSLITSVKNYKASALYCLGGIDQIYNSSTIPTIWNMALKDITEDPNRLTTANANYQKLQQRTIPSQYYVNQPTPLNVTRFTIIPGISSAGSLSIFNALKGAGYLDSNNYFNIDPRVSSSWQSVIPAPYNTAAFVPGIDDQMYVVFTQHKFYKDSNYRTISFFNQF